MAGARIVVLDNGGGNIKVGFGGQSDPVKVFPNATGKLKGERTVYVGDALLDVKDVAALALRRPVDRGYVVNWDLEKEIWARSFKAALHCKPADCGLLLTEPLLNLPSIQEVTDQVVFEEFGFQTFCGLPAPALALQHHMRLQPDLLANQAGCGLVVDAGFSFTHAAPLFDGRVVEAGVRRINLGGKVLTNYLKELVSYRSINMMEETHLVEHIKEAVCFVSQDLHADLAAARAPGAAAPHRLEYVLPDGVHNLRGFARPPQPAPKSRQDKEARERAREQVLALNNERFMVPELLFNPSDIGLGQAGLAQSIVDSVQAVHPSLHGLLYSNVVVVGGTAACPGFVPRLERELRPLVPTEYPLTVSLASDPALAAWRGGSALAASPQYAQLALTKAQYEEQGSAPLHGGAR